MKTISLLGSAIWDIFVLIIVIAIIIRISKVYKKMNLTYTTKKMLWRVSFVLALLTPFIIPVRVIDKVHFEKLAFGFPFGFVVQYPGNAAVGREFPFITTLVNPWGHSIAGNLNIRVDLFIFSMISIYLILSVLVNIVNKARG